MTICISCGLESKEAEKNINSIMKRDDDGKLHWKECHNVGGKVKAGFLYD